MVKYYLTENLLTERPNDYTAVAVAMTSLDKEGLITEIMDKGSTLTRTDVVAVFNAMEEVIRKASLNGISINLSLFNTSFSISGVFEGTEDMFDENRHKFNINVTKGVLLREAEKNTKCEKTHAPAAPLQIREVKDTISGKVNECLTARGVVEVRGYNIKIEGEDPACGLWFVAENGATAKAEAFVENKPSKVFAIIPNLDAANGAYKVKIVTQSSGGGGVLLKTARIFMFPKNLTIINA